MALTEKKDQMIVGEQISATRHVKQREMSFQVKHLLAPWSPGEARKMEHHWEVLTPLRLQATSVLMEFICAAPYSKHNLSCLKRLLLSNRDGQQDETGHIKRHEKELKWD